MGKSVSKFVWHDVMTTDVDAAEDFYAKVVGWQMKDSGMDGPRYTLLMDGERMAGGIMPTPDDASDVPPMWMGYIGVDDIDAKAKELEAAGGTVHRGPQDIPGIGRFFVQSALNRDYTLVMGTVVVIAIFVVLFNLVVDLLYAWLDPRVRVGRGEGGR